MIFLLSVFVISNDAITKICVCEITCPLEFCKDAQQIISENFDEQFEKIKTANMEILFSSSTKPFSFSLTTLNLTTVSFKSISNPASIILNVEKEVKSNITFSSLYIEFNGSKTIKASSLTIKNSSIKIDGSWKIFAESLCIDFLSAKMFDKFHTQNLTYDITSDFDAQVLINDTSIQLSMDEKQQNFIFDYQHKSAKLMSTSRSQGAVISKSQSKEIIDLSLDGFINITFSEYNWSCNNIVKIINRNNSLTIKSLSAIISATILSESYNVTIVVSKPKTQFSGSIAALTTIFRTVSNGSRFPIEILGDFNSSCYLTTSYIDLNIKKFSKLRHSIECPFIFTIGYGGSSTVMVNNSQFQELITVYYSKINFVLEFDHFLKDDELRNLIGKNISILKLSGFRANLNPTPVFRDAPNFIHGFNSSDCLLSIHRQPSATKVEFFIFVQSLDETPLSLCIGNCGEFNCPMISKNELTYLTKKYFVPGIKNLILYIRTPIESIELTDFHPSQTGLDVKLVGTENQEGSMKIDFGDSQKINENIVNLTLEKLTLDGEIFLNVPNVTIINCQGAPEVSLSFFSGVNLTADEMFVFNLAPEVTGKISNFTFLMNSFDTVTFYDDCYGFESISEMGVLRYSLFESFCINYDVGSRTAESSVYLVANTDKTPDITISFSLFEYKYLQRTSLVFKNWSNTKNPGKINLCHSQFPVNIVLTEPSLPSTLKVVGDGEVTYITHYTDSFEICAYYSSSDECPEDVQKAAFSDLDNVIASHKEGNLTVYVVGSDENNHLRVSSKTINKKQIKFVAVKSQEYLDLSKDETKLEKKFTTTCFDNFVIGCDQASKNSSLTFGELQFINCEFTSDLETVGMEIEDFITDYSTLYKFRDIRITNNLIVSGALVDIDKVIVFDPDENSEDLKATISESTTITMGENYVQIGKLQFRIQKSNNFDVILIPDGIKHLDFTYKYRSNPINVPFIRIPEAQNIQLNFLGSWPELLALPNYLVSIRKSENCTICASSENIPLEIECIAQDFNLVALSKKVSISGSLKFYSMPGSKTVFLYDNTTLSNCQIELKGGIFINNDIEIEMIQSELEVVIPSIHKIKSESYEIPSVQFDFYIDENGNSFVTVFDLDHVHISSHWEVLFGIKGSLDDEIVKNFLSKETTLLQTNGLTLPLIEVKTLKFSSTIHGINEKTFEVLRDFEKNRIVIKNIISPYLVPFELCYGPNADCEIVVNDSNIGAFYELLPKNDQLNLRFEFQSSPGYHVLDFDVSNFKEINVTMSSKGGYPIICSFGDDKINNLEVNFLNITVVSSFRINNVYLKNKGIFLLPTDISGIQNLLCDYSSFSSNFISGFNNNLTIAFNDDLSYVITFNVDGWTISLNDQFSHTFTKNNFPHLCFDLNGTNTLTFNVVDGITEVHNIHIISSHKYIVIGPNWNKVNNSEIDLTLKENLQKIHVESSSFPFRPFSKILMNANSVILSTKMFPVTIDEPIILYDEHYTINFDNFYDRDKEHLYINEIVFKENSSLVSEDIKYGVDKMPAQIKRAIVSESSIGSIASGKVMDTLQIRANGTFVVDGIFVADEAVIQMFWDLNKFPKLQYNYPISYLPKRFEIIFEGSFKSIIGKIDEFNKFIHQHSYVLVSEIPGQICENWIKKLSFISTIPFFNNGDDLVFQSLCNNGNLTIYGKDRIPDFITPSPQPSPSSQFPIPTEPFTEPFSSSPDNQNDEKEMKENGIIVAAVFAGLAVCAIITVSVLIYRKNHRPTIYLNDV